LRVTTQALPWVNVGAWDKIASGFDQQATAVLIARIAIFRSETEHLYDVLKSLDKSLIKFVKLILNIKIIDVKICNL
jgi:protein transport protein SEC23